MFKLDVENAEEPEINIQHHWTIKKKKNSLIRFIDTENRLVVAIGILGWEVGEMGEGYQKGQISSYIMNKSWEYNVQYGCYS